MEINNHYKLVLYFLLLTGKNAKPENMFKKVHIRAFVSGRTTLRRFGRFTS